MTISVDFAGMTPEEAKTAAVEARKQISAELKRLGKSAQEAAATAARARVTEALRASGLSAQDFAALHGGRGRKPAWLADMLKSVG